MKEQAVVVGDVVQLCPERNKGFWAGNFLHVTEVRSWGIQGFAKCEKGDAWYRAEWESFEVVGKAPWAKLNEETAE
tara:strand:+ start:834 stop:1061 length:228 start_codon:yes stop_codon:yes gene_type:complete